MSNLFMKEWNARTSNHAMLRAVVVTFEALLEAGKEPSCTYWTANHAYLRRHALPQILGEWSAQTGLAEETFPWTEDEIATTWEEWRKCNLKYREAFLRQLNLHGLADAYAEKQRQKLQQA